MDSPGLGKTLAKTSVGRFFQGFSEDYLALGKTLFQYSLNFFEEGKSTTAVGSITAGIGSRDWPGWPNAYADWGFPDPRDICPPMPAASL